MSREQTVLHVAFEFMTVRPPLIMSNVQKSQSISVSTENPPPHLASCATEKRAAHLMDFAIVYRVSQAEAESKRIPYASNPVDDISRCRKRPLIQHLCSAIDKILASSASGTGRLVSFPVGRMYGDTPDAGGPRIE